MKSADADAATRDETPIPTTQIKFRLNIFYLASASPFLSTFFEHIKAIDYAAEMEQVKNT